MNFKLSTIIQLFIVGISLFYSSASAQIGATGAEFNLSTMVPTSPEAALLGRFGDIPVGKYTGTADISIPIWTMNEDNLGLPITLQYSSSGIKVNDEATWVGLGWSLDPGGSIIQVVNGRSDQSDDVATTHPQGYANILASSPSWFNGRPEFQDAVWPDAGVNGSDDHETLWNLAAGLGQPDIYMFSFAGHSGQFYINPIDKSVVIIDCKENILFEQLNSNNWTAKTIDGNIFTFSAVETSTDYTQFYDYNFTRSTWKLTQIRFSNNKTINFNYSDCGSISHQYYENYRDATQANPNLIYTTRDWYESYNRSKYLSEIITSDTRIVFNLGFDREDIESLIAEGGIVYKTPKLDSIEIYSLLTLKKIKSFQFTYSYFPFTTIGGSYMPNPSDIFGKRLKLDAIQEIGYDLQMQENNSTKPPHLFFYNQTLLPLKTSYAQDYWGYYNGVDNTMLIPDLLFYHNSGAYPEFSIYPQRLFDGSIILNGGSGLADRTVDTMLIRAGVLEKIKYPTGGYTTFHYESNEFSNHCYPLKSQEDNSTFHIYLQDKNEPGDTRVHEFALERTITLHFVNRITKGTPLQTITFQQMLPAKISLYKLEHNGGSNPEVSLLGNWQMTNNYETENQFNTEGYIKWEDDILLSYDENATYQWVVYLPDELGPQNTTTGEASVTSQFTYYNIPSAYLAKSYGGGIRIAAINNFDSDDKCTGIQSFKYEPEANPDQYSSGILMSPLNFIYQRSFFDVGYHCTSNNTFPVNWIINSPETKLINFMTAQSNIPFSNSSVGNTVGYSRVVVSQTDQESKTNGKHVYFYHNLPNEVYSCVPNKSDLLDGTLEREEIFDNMDFLTNDVNYSYKNILPTTNFTGIKCFNATDVDPNAPMNCLLANAQNLSYFMANWPAQCGSYAKRYFLAFYHIGSEWNVLDSKITNLHTSVGTVTDTISYDYNSIGQIIQSKAKNSKAQEILKHYRFPIDVATPTNNTIVFMKNNRLYDRLLEETNSIGGQLKETTTINYDIIPNTSVLAQTSIQKKIENYSQYYEAEFNIWDPNRNLLQYSKDELKTSMMWGYDSTYLIAETKNATTNECGYLGFENNETMDWTVIPNSFEISNDQAFSKTGEFVAKISGNHFGPGKEFQIGGTANNHSGYKAYAWVKVNGSAYIRLEVVNHTSINCHTIKCNADPDHDPNQWYLIEAEIPLAKYKNFINSDFKLKAYVGCTDGVAFFDDFRFHSMDAQMTTYTYKPLIGMTSSSDINNKPTYYNFDNLGRLWLVRDFLGNILKKYDYHYKE